MDKVSHKLGRAIGVCTANSSLVFVTHNRSVTGRTKFWKLKRHRIFAVFFYRKNLRNNLSGFTDNYRITYANTFFIYKIFVVERCTAYCSTCKKYRFKNSDRSKHACSADIYFNFKQFCRLFFGRIFICLRPFRIFCGTAQ